MDTWLFIICSSRLCWPSITVRRLCQSRRNERESNPRYTSSCCGERKETTDFASNVNDTSRRKYNGSTNFSVTSIFVCVLETGRNILSDRRLLEARTWISHQCASSSIASRTSFQVQSMNFKRSLICFVLLKSESVIFELLKTKERHRKYRWSVQGHVDG